MIVETVNNSGQKALVTLPDTDKGKSVLKSLKSAAQREELKSVTVKHEKADKPKKDK